MRRRLYCLILERSCNLAHALGGSKEFDIVNTMNIQLVYFFEEVVIMITLAHASYMVNTVLAYNFI